MKEIVMYDQRITALAIEVNAHPALLARMKEAEAQGAKAHSTIFTGQAGDPDIPVIQGFEQAIGFLAAEVGLLLHGTYNYEAICDICDKIRQRLIEKRTVEIGEKPKPVAQVPTGKYLH